MSPGAPGEHILYQEPINSTENKDESWQILSLLRPQHTCFPRPSYGSQYVFFWPKLGQLSF